MRRALRPSGCGEAKPRQTQKPITDPDVLARRNAALAKARAARSEKLAAVRAAETSGHPA